MVQETQRFAHERTSINAGGSIDDFDESILRKREHFCFCCCDYRTAVIAIDVLMVIDAVQQLSSIDDDKVGGTTDRGFPDEGVEKAVVVFRNLVNLALFIGGIYGAIRYVRIGVILAGVGHFLGLLYTLFSMLAPDGGRIGSEFDDVFDDDAIDDDDEVAELLPGIAVGLVVPIEVFGAVLSCLYLHAHVKLLRLMKQGVILPP